MNDIQYDHLVKIILVGDSGTGKSAILHRYTDDTFLTSYISTIGVDFKITTCKYNDKNIKLQIWDTAGQERFQTITTTYYRGSHAIIVVYDITDRDSFDNVTYWISQIKKYAADNVNILLIGNKNDLNYGRKVSQKEGEEFAAKYDIDFIETSAKNSCNVKNAFITIAKKTIERLDKKNTNSHQNPNKKLVLINETHKPNEKNNICGCY